MKRVVSEVSKALFPTSLACIEIPGGYALPGGEDDAAPKAKPQDTSEARKQNSSKSIEVILFF